MNLLKVTDLTRQFGKFTALLIATFSLLGLKSLKLHTKEKAMSLKFFIK